MVCVCVCVCVFIIKSAGGLCVIKLPVDVVGKRTMMILLGNALNKKCDHVVN